MRILLVSLVTLVTLAACGGGNENPSAANADQKAPQTNTSVYKYAGSVQCTGGGTSLAAMERQLTDAGIQVLASACGADGKLYPTVCGTADGRIGIMEVPADQAQAASALGFAPLSNLPEATRVPC